MPSRTITIDLRDILSADALENCLIALHNAVQDRLADEIAGHDYGLRYTVQITIDLSEHVGSVEVAPTPNHAASETGTAADQRPDSDQSRPETSGPGQPDHAAANVQTDGELGKLLFAKGQRVYSLFDAAYGVIDRNVYKGDADAYVTLPHDVLGTISSKRDPKRLIDSRYWWLDPQGNVFQASIDVLDLYKADCDGPFASESLAHAHAEYRAVTPTGLPPALTYAELPHVDQQVIEDMGSGRAIFNADTYLHIADVWTLEEFGYVRWAGEYRNADGHLMQSFVLTERGRGAQPTARPTDTGTAQAAS